MSVSIFNPNGQNATLYTGAVLEAKILFVEDELSLQKSVSYILEKEGLPS